MSDPCRSNGLCLVRGPDRPPLAQQATGGDPPHHDAATRLAHVMRQIDEIRLLNKRLDLANLELTAQNKELRVRMAKLEDHNRHTEAHVAILLARLDCRRYRMIDRLHRLSRKAPLLHGTSRFVLVKGFAAMKKLRNLVVGRKPSADAQAP